MQDSAAFRRETVRIGRLLYDRQLVVGTEGNLSIRLGSDRFLVTRAGACKGLLGEADLLVVDSQGRTVSPSSPSVLPSSEWPLHREIYARRPEVDAVCHGHPPWATAFAAAGLPLDGCLLPEIIATLGTVPLAPYGTPGTEEVPATVREMISSYSALLLANHGVVAMGATLTEAFFRLESVERLAQVTLLARLAGGEHRLTAAQAAALQPFRTGLPAGSAPPACVPAMPMAASEQGDRQQAGTGGPSRTAGDGVDHQAAMEELVERLAREILAELRGLT